MHSLMLWTYFPIIALSLISYASLKRVGVLAISSPMIFFVISNFGVWLNSSTYANNLNGLILCYTNAIPFYASSALACILFSAAFYSLTILIRKVNTVTS